MCCFEKNEYAFDTYKLFKSDLTFRVSDCELDKAIKDWCEGIEEQAGREA